MKRRPLLYENQKVKVMPLAQKKARGGERESFDDNLESHRQS